MLSEVLSEPGPTHSVFDVLAASVSLHPRPRRVGLLGFGGGGVVAALRGMGLTCRVEGVDLDAQGWSLFREEGDRWSGSLTFRRAEAVSWLSQGRRPFDVIIEDLSVPRDGAVEKPAATWETLPDRISRRLAPGGLAVFNLLRPPGGSWPRLVNTVSKPFGPAAEIRLAEFHNRIVVAWAADGVRSGPEPGVGGQLRTTLRALGSRQASGIRVCRLRGGSR